MNTLNNRFSVPRQPPLPPTSHLHIVRTPAIGAALLLVFSTFLGAQCPSTMMNTFAVAVVRYSTPPRPTGGPVCDLILGPGNCTAAATTYRFGTPYGPFPPTQCQAYVTGINGNAFVQAIFMSAISNTDMNGCIFPCPGGTCRIRGGDGLPVEL